MNKLLYKRSIAPTVNDDISAGYYEGVFWLAGGVIYQCQDAAIGNAEWTAYNNGFDIHTISSTYDDTGTHNHLIIVDSNAAITYTLPLACKLGQEVTIKTKVGTNNLDIAPKSGNKIDGSASNISNNLLANASMKFISDGVNGWWIVSTYKFP